MNRPDQSVEEAALVARVAAGAEGAMADFYDRYAGLVMAITQRMLRDWGEAEALAEDCFVELWRRAAQYTPERGSVATWIATLVRSRGIDHLRSRQRRAVLGQRDALREAPASSADQDPGRETLAAEERQRVRALLGDLSDDQRRALELCYFEGLTHQEVAVRLSRPLGTVKTHIREGLIHLRRLLRIHTGGQP